MLSWVRGWRESRAAAAALRERAPGAAELVDAVRNASGRESGSLCVYGDFFGRPYDNVHRAIAATLDPEGCALIGFDDHETLRVWDPEGIHIGAGEFRVERASKVRWEWYSYGDPRTPENLYFIEHRVVGDNVEASTNSRPSSFNPHLSRPAIELLDGLA